MNRATDPADPLLGAELLAGRGLLALVGIGMETLLQMSEVAERQRHYLVQDWSTTAKALLDGAARATPLPMLMADHAGRRVRHVLEGVEQAAGIISSRSQQSWESMLRLWSPFETVAGYAGGPPRLRAG